MVPPSRPGLRAGADTMITRRTCRETTGDQPRPDQAARSGDPRAVAQAGGQARPRARGGSAPDGGPPALAQKPTVTKGTGTLTKLNVTTLVQGTGPAVRSGQNLTVNYVGVSYTTGEEFDASWKTGQPFPFQVGTGSVIKGWDQGLIGVKVGSRVQLDIPSDLAYGDNPGGGQPAGPLRFVVDVLDAK